jgi:hypothetical protein
MKSAVNTIMSIATLLFTGLVSCGPSASSEDTPVQIASHSAGLSGGTWQPSSYEDCYALYGGSCYARRWTPSCLSYTGSWADPRGTPCSTISSNCWYVLNSRWVIEYECR